MCPLESPSDDYNSPLPPSSLQDQLDSFEDGALLEVGNDTYLKQGECYFQVDRQTGDPLGQALSSSDLAENVLACEPISQLYEDSNGVLSAYVDDETSTAQRAVMEELFRDKPVLTPYKQSQHTSLN